MVLPPGSAFGVQSMYVIINLNRGFWNATKKVREPALNKMVAHAKANDALQHIELVKPQLQPYNKMLQEELFACYESYQSYCIDLKKKSDDWHF